MYTVADLMSSDPQSNITDAVKRALIIEYGTIEKVREDGLVEVSFACRTNKYTNYITCRYFSPLMTSDLKVTVPPKAGDKVMLLSPRQFSPDMFSSEVSVEVPELNGYRLHSFIALPFWNEQAEKAYTSSIEADSDGIRVKTKADMTVTIVDEEDTELASITLDRNKNLSIINSEGGSLSMSGEDGSVTINNHFKVTV